FSMRARQGAHSENALTTPQAQEEIPPAASDQPGLSPLPAAPISHLPYPLTRFFGHEEDIAQLERMLQPQQGAGTAGTGPEASEADLERSAAACSPARLVTLVGLGGSGKTRLALAVAERLRASFRDAIWYVSL